MKKIIQLLILSMGFYFNANSQTMPTRGEIYDFDVNDEFQFQVTESGYFGNLPNATRYVIIDKFYSAAHDTVFYGRHFDNYTSYVDFTPPVHLVYLFNSFTDTISYTNLDTLINADYANEYTDSCSTSSDTLFYASDFCGNYVYQHSRCFGCCFEGQFTRLIYGVGIGQAYYHYNYPSEFYEITRTLFYYKKGTIECGEPDLLTVSVNEPGTGNKITQVYPNPADNVIHFNTGLSKKNKVTIYNSLGNIVLSLNEYKEGPVNVSSLENGFYFVLIENDHGKQTCKFIINRN